MNQTAFPLLQMLQSAGSQSADRLLKLVDGGLEGVEADEFRSMLESTLADLGIEFGELDLAGELDFAEELDFADGGNTLPALESVSGDRPLDGAEAITVLERLMAFVRGQTGNGAALEAGMSSSRSSGLAKSGGSSIQLQSQPVLLPGAGAEMDDGPDGAFQRLMLLNAGSDLAGSERPGASVSANADARQALQSINAQQFAALSSSASQSGEVSTMNRMPPIQSPVGGQAWGEALGQRILMMKGQGMDRAEVRLNPPQLGPLEIRLNVTQEQTSLVLSSQNALTRDALEQALPRLREMFDARGLAMGDTEVSDGSAREQTDSRGDGQTGGGREAGGQGASLVDGGRQDSTDDEVIQVGLLDEYV